MTLQWHDANHNVRSAVGVLENVSPEGFGVRTKRAFKDGQTVWVTRADSPALKSIVRHVAKDEDAYVLGFARITNEKRREDRSPATGAAMLRCMGPNGETLSHEVQIRNVSPEGVQVCTPMAAPAGEVARLIGTAVECVGAIRYCVPWNDKFLVGLFLIGKAQRRSSLELHYHD
ncbi:MAG: hypothetical protein R2724_02620 [Bryobacterales bacterium]